ncbi:quercetin dioxygenase-like cupin family protein [Nonomuraea thailandensis]|uniref:Quercetin dioxygenase-like cupin family protein n=1 Tax=Nonomuraea thailandensis TaxID=1188745 RepID=A0A9X2GG28_9ACTN|nr:cupin domain-containing protein [Nonomuraea thailandensis]MCP2357027.1 quercetin dioxygenase-like cupin family protein [Nonomuraea thailandensis]
MLTTLSAIPPTRVWKDVLARVIHGEQLTLAVVELPPGGLVPEHRHVNEQIGLCLHGTLTFRVGQETRDLGPGGSWRILANVAHEVQAGPEGAVVVEAFAPARDDWAGLEQAAPAPPRWPSTH